MLRIAPRIACGIAFGAAVLLAVPGPAGEEEFRQAGFIGRLAVSGHYLFRVETGDDLPTGRIPPRPRQLNVDLTRLSGKEVEQAATRLSGMGNLSRPIAAFVRATDRLEVVSFRDGRWNSEGFLETSDTSDPYFTEDGSGSLWAIVRFQSSPHAQVFHKEGSRWRSMLRNDSFWNGNPTPDPDDAHAIDWGLLTITPRSTRRWAEPPPGVDASAFLYRKLRRGGGAAIRADGVPGAFLLTAEKKWKPLRTGPWGPTLANDGNQLDTAAAFDPHALVLLWYQPQHAVRYGRVTKEGWEVLFDTPPLSAEDSWRQPRALAPYGSGYVAFSTFIRSHKSQPPQLAAFIWTPGSPVRSVDIPIQNEPDPHIEH